MLSGHRRFFKSLSAVSIIGALSLTCIQVIAQNTPPALIPKTTITPTLPQKEKGETPIMETSYEFSLRRGNVLSPLTPDQSSDEVITSLAPATEEEAKNIVGFQHLVAILPLRKENPQKVMFARSEETNTYDMLIVDRDLDGSFVDEAPIIIDKKTLIDDITQTKSRDGKHMIEFKTALMTDHIHPRNLPSFGDYPAILRLKWNNLSSTPKELIWFGYYFYKAEIPVADKTYEILLHDVNNDGIITAPDLWMLKDKSLEITDNVSRNITDYNWINGIAWKIEILNPKGSRAYIHRYDPKISYEQDISNRDPWSSDKVADRAEWKDRLTILTDHDKALKKSVEKQKHLILKFESTWCDACNAINNFILPQQTVVDASKDYVWARFNDEENTDLTSLYNVKNYPTFIILNPNGKEVKRFSKVNGELLTKHLQDSLKIDLTEELEPNTLASHSSPALTKENSEESNQTPPEAPQKTNK